MKFVIAAAGCLAAANAVDPKSTNVPKDMFEEIQRDMMETHKKMLEPFKETSKRRKQVALDQD